MLKTDSFFKALSDQTRLSCLILLAKERELCVCELVEALEVSQPLVSRHLAYLRGAGIVDDERRGQWVHYRLHPTLPDWAADVLRTVESAEADSPDMKRARERLAAMLPRPPRKCV